MARGIGARHAQRSMARLAIPFAGEGAGIPGSPRKCGVDAQEELNGFGGARDRDIRAGGAITEVIGGLIGFPPHLLFRPRIPEALLTLVLQVAWCRDTLALQLHTEAVERLANLHGTSSGQKGSARTVALAFQRLLSVCGCSTSESFTAWTDPSRTHSIWSIAHLSMMPRQKSSNTDLQPSSASPDAAEGKRAQQIVRATGFVTTLAAPRLRTGFSDGA
ncbi:hypothetical protein MVEN_00029600 [Mycena venus]|uniref:Uncharacterized protein n=1 Tax=Mycena venus TaxID=2733690 RepID=A0A8H6Z7F5_9AGAR|nr:hypothetical protein MVEN_00029600 [Mycena venus]